MTLPSSPPAPRKPPLRLLAFGTAVSVATIYLTQPILHLLAGALHTSTRQMGFVTTVTQLGYAAGIIFLVPLGDVIAKKKLILAKLLLVALTLVATGLATGVKTMIAGSLAIGLFATAAQDFIPLAAELSPAASRGQAIGTVMGGLLLGILGSRLFSGALVEWGGWRLPFFAAAALALLVAVLVGRRVPAVAQTHTSSYPALLLSMAELVRTRPLLALSTVGQGCIGFTFSAFWTVLSFHLGDAPFHLSPGRIGAFALAGFAGAAIAPFAGRLADRHGPLFNIRGGLLLVALSFGAMLAWPQSLLVLILGAIGFDLGVQLAMVSHQTVIYALEPSARSRLNAVYVGGLFGFFALGSFGATWIFAAQGWPGVMKLCLGSCGAAALVHLALTRAWRRWSAAA